MTALHGLFKGFGVRALTAGIAVTPGFQMYLRTSLRTSGQWFVCLLS